MRSTGSALSKVLFRPEPTSDHDVAIVRGICVAGPTDAVNLWRIYHPECEDRGADVIETTEFISFAAALPEDSRKWLVCACLFASPEGAWYAEAADQLALSIGWPNADTAFRL